MSLIHVQNLTYCYEGSFDNIFEDVSFSIDTDWKLGFIGRNGRGKTTFLRLLMGQCEYEGTIAHSTVFDYFPFPVEDPTQDTLDVALELYPQLQDWELMKELSLLEVDAGVLYRPFQSLSNGEQTKVLLAILFLRENHFLLIDEPTNHLDTHARQVVSRYLRSKKGFILVSHDRAFLDDCIDHVLSINRQDIELQRGNYSSWKQNKDWQDQNELEENARLKKEVKRLTRSMRQTAQWSDKIEASKIGDHAADRGFIGHKAAKMMMRSKAIENRQQSALDQKSELLKNIETAEPLSISPLAYPKSRLASARDLQIQYGETPVNGPVTFTIERGDRVAFTGRNGSGKSSILKLLLGEEIPHTGTLEVGSGLILSCVPQDASFLRGNLRDFAEEENIDETLFKTILRKLDFSRAQFEKNMEDYSAGQKKKVLLARSLCQKAHLYVWDEPLNYVDIFSRIQLEELLARYAPTMVFVEHDQRFVENLATKTVELTL